MSHAQTEFRWRDSPWTAKFGLGMGKSNSRQDNNYAAESHCIDYHRSPVARVMSYSIIIHFHPHSFVGHNKFLSSSLAELVSLQLGQPSPWRDPQPQPSLGRLNLSGLGHTHPR